MAHVHWSLGTRGQRPEHINGCGQGSNVTQQTFRVSGTRNDWIQLTRNDPIASALNVNHGLVPASASRPLTHRKRSRAQLDLGRRTLTL